MITNSVTEQGAYIPRRPSTIPIWMTAAYTLKISLHFMSLRLMGQGSVEHTDDLLHWWGRKILAAGNVGLDVSGQEHIAPGKPFVVMSNHRSLLDIPALFLAVPSSLRMVLKEELTRIPIWGRALVLSGFVPVDRGNIERARQQLEEAKRRLERGICIWIAPEGTRSRDGQLGPFKKGGFHMARQLGVPIVPTWIDGSEEIVPVDSFDVHYNGRMSIDFGAPIPTEGVAEEDLSGLVERVREAMLALQQRR